MIDKVPSRETLDSLGCKIRESIPSDHRYILFVFPLARGKLKSSFCAHSFGLTEGRFRKVIKRAAEIMKGDGFFDRYKRTE